LRNGWTRSVGGKHNVKMTKPDHRPVTLPKHLGEALEEAVGLYLDDPATTLAYPSLQVGDVTVSAVPGIPRGA
jgi:hypothetical protein